MRLRGKVRVLLRTPKQVTLGEGRRRARRAAKESLPIRRPTESAQKPKRCPDGGCDGRKTHAVAVAVRARGDACQSCSAAEVEWSMLLPA